MLKRNSISLFIFLGVFSLAVIFILQLTWLNKTINLQDTTIEIQNKEDSLNLVQFTEQVHTSLRSVLEQISTNHSDSSDLYGAVKQIRTNRFVVDINEELQPFYLETLLKREFYDQSVNQDFQYGIYDCFSDSIVYGNLIRFSKDYTSQESPDTNSVSAHQNLNWKKDGHYFTVFFPNVVNKKIESEAKLFNPWWYILLIVLLIGFFFWFALAIILKQRRLSEIKNDFINNMTHELKTPISTIGLSSEMLLKSETLTQPEKIQRYAGIIFKENKRLENQVERVLNVAKLDKKTIVLKKTGFDIHEILQEVKDNFDFNQEEKGGIIELQLSAGEYTILADEVHITNVLFNLIDNATKYCEKTPKIIVRTHADKRFLIIEVEDNGIGLKKEDIPQIFEKFFRVHTGNRHDVKGFGLGLYYIKTIIDAHHGKIDVRSTMGKGTTFMISLPLKYID